MHYHALPEADRHQYESRLSLLHQRIIAALRNGARPVVHQWGVSRLPVTVCFAATERDSQLDPPYLLLKGYRQQKLTHGSLFSGIGGFDLAAHWAGIPTLWQVEKDEYCRAVLAKHFPEAKRYDEIKGLSGLAAVDIISGGFPCQPFSVAGKRAGTEDDRYLWPEMLRIVAEVRPTWVIAENVAGIIRMELDNCIASLEGEGYAAWPIVIPACAVDAPHRRDRVWIVGYSGHWNRISATSGRVERQVLQEGKRNESADATQGSGTERSGNVSNSESGVRLRKTSRQGRYAPQRSKDVSDATSQRCGEAGTDSERPAQRIASKSDVPVSVQFNDDDAGHGASQVCRQRSEQTEIRECLRSARGGTSPLRWLPEPDVGRVAHGVSSRVDRLRALGNAIAPQVAFQIFEAIKQVDGPHLFDVIGHRVESERECEEMLATIELERKEAI